MDSNTVSLDQYRAKAKRSKYGNNPMTIQGERYRSRREFTAHIQLQALYAGSGATIEREVRFPLIVNKQKVATYIADFVVTSPGGARKVYDCKPKFKIKKARETYQKTGAWRVFRIKQKLMKACYDIDVEVI